MPSRSRLVRLQIANQQYHDLPDELRELVDRRVAQLLESPTVDADAIYNERFDQWSVPLAMTGSFYAVVREPATLIILRVVSLT